MDKKTRTLKAFRGEKVDRPPYTFWHHFGGDQTFGKSNVAAHAKFYRESGEDFLKMMCDGYMYIPLGIKIKSASDWDHIRLPKLDDPFITQQVDKIKMFRDLEGEACVFYNMFAAFSNIRFATSDELVMAHMRENRPAVLRALDAVAQVSAEMARLFVQEGGATGVFLPIQGGERDRFSVEEYKEYISPSDLVTIRAANAVSDYNIVHLCGWAGIQNHLDAWRDYPAAVINWDVHTDKMSLKEGKTYFTHCNAVMGGFDNKAQSVIYHADKAALQQYTRELVAQAGKDGLVLSSDCSLDESIPYERLAWIGEALDSLI